MLINVEQASIVLFDVWSIKVQHSLVYEESSVIPNTLVPRDSDFIMNNYTSFGTSSFFLFILFKSN